MDYKIMGSVMPAVEIKLNRGEGVFTQTGGMCWMSEGVDMETNTKGGLFKGIGRMFAGESLFMTTYRAEKDGAFAAFSSTVPGKIKAIDLRGGKTIICQKCAFLCAEDCVDVKAVFTKKLSAGLFGGEGFILQQIQGEGTVFLEIDGDCIEKELAPGEIIKVDTGNVVCFDNSVKYDIEMLKGGMNIFLGGEGLFITTLTGPGKVMLQTQNFAEFAGRISQYITLGKK